MRKDVKFGLTVGGILVATLIVYVIVLSGGGLSTASKQDGKTLAVEPDNFSQTATPITESVPPAAPAHNDTVAHADTPSSPAPAGVNGIPTPTPSPIAADTAHSATQPSADSAPKFDWDTRLTQGGDVPVASIDAPVRTVTPTISHDSNGTHTALVSTETRPPTIDNIIPLMATADSPATQPALHPTVNDDTMATADPIPAVAPKAEKTHVIASGESLWTIAQAVYGNGAYYTKIAAANPSIDPKNLKVGKTLVIPDIATDKSAASSAGSTSSSLSNSNATPVDASTSYKVAGGDTLEKISRKLYGDGSMQDKLYDLNKSLIGQDPDKLKIGWVLKLPKAPTATADASH